MGSGTLSTRANAQVIDQTWFNQFLLAFVQDLIPRNSSGVATDQAGSLGSASLRFLNAYVMSMYLMDGSHYIKQIAPSGLSNNITIQWPGALPGQTNVMTMTAAGVISSVTWDAVGQAMTSVGANAIAASTTRTTGTSVGIGGVAVSGASGVFTTVSATYVDVTNLLVQITTSGRPVKLMLQPQNLASSSYYGIPGSNFNQNIRILNLSNSSGWVVGAQQPSLVNGVQACSLGIVDVSVLSLPSTYTYKVQLLSNDASTAAITNAVLVALEL